MLLIRATSRKSVCFLGQTKVVFRTTDAVEDGFQQAPESSGVCHGHISLYVYSYIAKRCQTLGNTHSANENEKAKRDNIEHRSVATSG